MQAGFNNDGSRAGWKNPAMVGAESYKVWFVVALEMRKLPAIKRLRHEMRSGLTRIYVGTAALGCPAERSSAGF